MSKIATTLHQLFDKHRIIFWYDEATELQKDFDALALDKVEKIHVQGDEFAIKYRIEKQECSH